MYDSSGRLAEVLIGGLTVATYSYDSNSNLTTVNSSGTIKNATYDEQDRILTFGTKTFQHNENGELTSVTDSSSSLTTNYTFDIFGNLKSAQLPSKLITYKVDSFNRRIVKYENSSVSEYYIWNPSGQLIGVADSSGNIVKRFVFASMSHSPDYMITASESFKIVSNHLGSPVLVINSATGLIEQEISYDEFGNILSDSNPGFTPFGFAGCLYDQDTKLCKFGARDYDASIGRWLSKDPILFAGGDTNLYGYVLQDPINLIDPEGKNALLLVGPVLAFEVGYDLGTFFNTLAQTGSPIKASQEVYNQSPLRNLFNTGTNALFPEPMAGPIQVFSNPDTMNAIIQRKQRANKLDQKIKACE